MIKANEEEGHTRTGASEKRHKLTEVENKEARAGWEPAGQRGSGGGATKRHGRHRSHRVQRKNKSWTQEDVYNEKSEGGIPSGGGKIWKRKWFLQKLLVNFELGNAQTYPRNCYTIEDYCRR